jgi:gas vesicle protein
MSNRSKIVLGLVGAAAAGVIVGLLLAPDNGMATRRRIKSTANDWADHLSDLFANAKGEMDKLRKKGSSIASDAAGMYNSARESYS